MKKYPPSLLDYNKKDETGDDKGYVYIYKRTTDVNVSEDSQCLYKIGRTQGDPIKWVKRDSTLNGETYELVK